MPGDAVENGLVASLHEVDLPWQERRRLRQLLEALWRNSVVDPIYPGDATEGPEWRGLDSGVVNEEDGELDDSETRLLLVEGLVELETDCRVERSARDDGEPTATRGGPERKQEGENDRALLHLAPPNGSALSCTKQR